MKNSLLLLYLCLFVLLGAYGQNCTLSVSISQSAPALCSGYNVTLTATPSGGTGPFAYVWSTGESTPSIVVDKAGTYTVTVSDKTPGCQPVKKSVDVTATTTPNAPTAAGQVVCANSSATLTATAPGGVYQWYNAPTNGTFLASGATYVTQPINVTTIFYVQTTVNGCTSPRTAVVVSLTAKPSAPGVSICSGNVATLTATGGSSYTWYSAANGGTVLSNSDTYTTPVLVTTTTYYVAAISGNGCASPRTACTVTVTANPPTPTASNVTICSGSPANLHASAPSGIFNWYNAANGGVPLISSPDYTTPPLNATTTYFVSTQINGCESARIPVKVFVNALPAAPTAQSDTTCYQSSITLTGSGSGAGTYQWYDAPGGNLLASGATFTTPVLTASITYYLRSNNGGCLSALSPINVIVRQQVPPPTAAGAIACNGAVTTLTASSPGGGTFQWYNAPAGGALLASGANFTTPPLKVNTTYYVQNTQSACTSGRTAVTVTVLAALTPPTAAGTTVCAGNQATLTASGSVAGYSWYDSANGGNLLSTAQVFVTPVLNATTSYYVATTENGCTSSRRKVTVTVTPDPIAPAINPVTVCKGMAATLTATGATGLVKWYDAPNGGNLLASGSTYKTPVLSSNTTYYAQSVLGQCTSAMVAVTVTINNTPEFQYNSGTFCASGANPVPVINDPGGGTFSAAPAGLVFVSTTTGEINIAASAPGHYVVSFTGKGACTVPASAKIFITNNTDAGFSYSTPVCQYGPNLLPTFSPTGSGGNFSAAPAGLVFINTSTGEIDLTNSQPGNYTITNSINASGACTASSSSFGVVINAAAIVSAGTPQTVVAGTPVQLAGSISGGTATGTWSGGTGSFSNPALPNAVYTPGAGEASATLTLTSADPPGPCGPVSSKVVITFNSQTAAPTASSVFDCSGSSATLTATAPGGTYEWYDAPAGGNLLATGPNYTTPALNAATVYYVQTTLNGITSGRTSVTVNINPIPAQPTAPGASICTGTKTTLTATGSPATYEWYDAPAGGNLLSSASTYTTPLLTANVSYYVQSVANTCVSARTQVDVSVTQKPNVTSVSTGQICSGQPLSYNITADLANTTFIWSRAKVAGISNPAVSNQASSSITETLINTGATSVNVTYVIIPSNGNCPGPSFNYVVTVYPTPAVTGPASATICNMTTDNYAITFSIPVTSFSWSRAAVPGISNLPVTGQTAGTIKEVLFNATNSPINVTYVITYNTATCTGIPFNLVITVNPQAVITSASTGTACTGSPQDYVITSSIPGSTFSWSRNAVPNISNPAVSNQTSGTITETLDNTGFGTVGVEYDITPIANGCPGTMFKYMVSVNPKLQVPVANSNSPVCVGSAIRLSTAPVANATYLWTGPNGFTTTQQNPVINNATAADGGTYTVVFINKGCSSLPVSVVVNVDPPAVADAGPDQAVCYTAGAVPLAGNVTGGTSTGIWSTAGSGTFAPKTNDLNAHYLPSAADKAAGSVVLTLTSTSKDNCTVSTSAMTITFSNETVTSAATGPACSGVAQNYVITSNSAGATFIWSRAAVAGISNPAVKNQASGAITEALTNTTAGPVNVVYVITPYVGACAGTPFKYTVTVNSTPVAPVAGSNSPVCVNTTLNLTATSIAGVTYSWTGPNGYTSTAQNPTIGNVSASNAGIYSVIYTLNGCDSPPATVTVAVDDPPAATASAPSQVCVSTASVPLTGSITGGTNTGIWSTSGTGTFSPTPTTVINASYLPSAADKAAGSVTLTLTSTSNDNCTVATAPVTIQFSTQPAVIAGPNQQVCSQTTNVPLNGQITIAGGAVWSTSGSGTFTPSNAQLSTTYNPSGADIKNGSVILKLTANDPGVCFTPADSLTVTFIPPPVISAGGTYLVLKGQTVTLNPTVNEDSVTYLWSPDIDIDNTTVRNPVVTGDIDRKYLLTVTDVRGCISQDTAFVKVSPTIVIRNTFTPNGDGINDYWDIPGLIAYQEAAVDIFDRWGQRVFHSLGYPKPWDGTFNGKPVPVGVYYYVINTHFNSQVLSGWVTVIR